MHNLFRKIICITSAYVISNFSFLDLTIIFIMCIISMHNFIGKIYFKLEKETKGGRELLCGGKERNWEGIRKKNTERKELGRDEREVRWT
jgi:hypothetical protein